MSKLEETLQLPIGAQWLKADLHVHTPASSDMAEKWKEATPEDVVQIALEKELDLIGITDHNSADWCDSVREAAESTTLTVFPGVEVSTHQGHVLALFDTNVGKTEIEDVLLEVGIRRNEFGSLDAVTEKGIVDVSDAIVEAGGVAIAAHADGNKGFLKMVSAGGERKRVYAAENLWAMEVLDSSIRDVYQEGSKSGYSRRMPCLQFSDCSPKGSNKHQLDGIANRYSLLKMDDRSIAGLKLALIDPIVRVRLPDDESPAPSQVILGMWVTGGFLDGQKIRFSDYVSCLIGDTGSGKSVATELIRFGLDQQTGVEKIYSEVESLLDQRLGELGTVHILLQKGDSTYLVERAWGNPPQCPHVQRVTDLGLEPIDNLDIRLLFPIKSFSQSEIIEFAREPNVRLSLTDDLIDCSAEVSSIEGLKTELRRNSAEIIAYEAKAENLRGQVAEKPSLSERVKNIDRILDDTRVCQQQLWYSEQNLISEVEEQIDQMAAKLEEIAAPLKLSLAWLDEVRTYPNQDLLDKIRIACNVWEAYVGGIPVNAKAKLQELTDSLKLAAQHWQSRFDIAEADYQRLLQELDKDGIGLQALSDSRKSLQDRIASLARMEQELNDEVLPRISSLLADRERLLTDLQANRRSVTAKRSKKAEDLTGKLRRRIRLEVHSRANVSALRESLLAIAKGSYLSSGDLDSLANKVHPVRLVKKLLSRDFDSLACQSGLESPKLERVLGTVLDKNRVVDLYELQLVDVEDVIEVKLELDSGDYRRLEDLSHGQKCMVVLMIALAEGDFPLLVDQPEDALHAPSIEKGIVAALRSGRGARQCVFATRNANILVSADAEQIIALEATAENGHVTATGSLDRFDHRKLVIYHVEGGEEAFQRRKKIYALEPTA